MNLIEIPKNRRDEIKQTVINALINGNSYNLPVKIKYIVKSYKNIRLISFSKHIKKFNLTYDKMIKLIQSEDSCTDYHAIEKKYIIFYNDINKNIIQSNRYRWNIAHELGHILLKHHINGNKTRIFRSKLTELEYNKLEAEADYFAQLILVPHMPLYEFKITNNKDIMTLCKISKPASFRRFKEYLQWKKHKDKTDFFDIELFYLYYNFIFKKKCNNCNAALVQKYKICPICGQKSLKWGDGKMIYPKLKTYENNKLYKCPICNNEETNLKGDYCQICGMHLINYCSELVKCGEMLPTNARYCPVCGAKSSFFKNNILKSWDNDVENTFMSIPYGVEEEGLPFN